MGEGGGTLFRNEPAQGVDAAACNPVLMHGEQAKEYLVGAQLEFQLPAKASLHLPAVTASREVN